jgi:hypothetical protein
MSEKGYIVPPPRGQRTVSYAAKLMRALAITFVSAAILLLSSTSFAGEADEKKTPAAVQQNAGSCATAPTGAPFSATNPLLLAAGKKTGKQEDPCQEQYKADVKSCEKKFTPKPKDSVVVHNWKLDMLGGCIDSAKAVRNLCENPPFSGE